MTLDDEIKTENARSSARDLSTRMGWDTAMPKPARQIVIESGLNIALHERNALNGDTVKMHKAYGEIVSWFARYADHRIQGTAESAAMMVLLYDLTKAVTSTVYNSDNISSIVADCGVVAECGAREGVA